MLWANVCTLVSSVTFPEAVWFDQLCKAVKIVSHQSAPGLHTDKCSALIAEISQSSVFDHEHLADPKSYGNSEGGVLHGSAEILVKTDHVIG